MHSEKTRTPRALSAASEALATKMSEAAYGAEISFSVAMRTALERGMKALEEELRAKGRR